MKPARTRSWGARTKSSRKRIPFTALPLRASKKLAKRFYGTARIFSCFLPDLKLNLMQSDLPYEDDEYLAIIILNTLVNFFLFFTIFFFILIIGDLLTLMNLTFITAGSFGLSGFTCFIAISYPKSISLKKEKEVEKDLLYALRELLIRSKSGIPLYNSMVGISSSNYGMISEEFKKAVKEIEAGKTIDAALEEMALRSGSGYFREAIWQMVSSMKTGADISRTLEASIENLSREQMVEIKSYGAELNPLALVYMMLSVIIPTLGITFLIILSSFLKVKISQEIFYVILVLLALFQFFFIGVIKTRRPSLIR